MNKVFLSGRITSDISRFGTDSKGGVSFTLVTSRPVIKDGEVQKDENGYTETYDQFHTVKAFNGLGKSIANHKKKGDKLIFTGEPPYAHAKVFFSLLIGDPVETEAALNQAAGFLRNGLFKRLHIHTVPTLHFLFDRTTERAADMNALIARAVSSRAKED